MGPVAERQDQPGSDTWTRPRCTRRAPLNKTILAFNHHCEQILSLAVANMTVWPSGLRRWLQAPVRKGVGSNLTAVTASRGDHWKHDTRAERQRLRHRCRFGHPKHEGPELGNQTRRATDTYDWGNQCPKTRNHETEHEEDEAEELHAPPQKKTTSGGKRQDQPGSNTWTRPRYTRWAPVNKTILAFNHNCEHILSLAVANMTV